MKLLVLFFLSVSLQCFGQVTNPPKPLRRMIVQPDYSNVKSSEDCTIRFRLTVDLAGNVVDAQVIPSLTNTTDQHLIDDLKQRILKQAKYEPVNQSENSAITISLKVKSNDPSS